MRPVQAACVWAGGCKGAENLTVPKPRRTGTGAIRQEFLINSRLSAPQAPGVKPFACPARRDSRALRFSRTFADARPHAHRLRRPHFCLLVVRGVRKPAARDLRCFQDRGSTKCGAIRVSCPFVGQFTQRYIHRPERRAGTTAGVYGGHLRGCEKILALRGRSVRGRRRASRPEPEEH